MLLRLFSLVLKLLIFTKFAELLSAKIFGEFIFFVSFVSLSVYISGLDFTSISHRDFFKKKISKNKLISTHLFIPLAPAFFITVIFFTFFDYEFLTFFSLNIFFLIVSEVYAADLIRHLRAFEKNTLANFVNLLKIILFSTVIVFITYFDRSISSILYIWLIANLFTIIFALHKLNFIFSRPDLSFFVFLKKLKGLKFFICITIFERLIMHLDKIILGYLGLNEMNSFYGFYFNLSLTYLLFLDAGLISRMYPQFMTVKNIDFKKLAKTYFTYLLLFTSISIFLYLLSIDFFLRVFLSSKDYADYKYLGLLYILGFYFYALSIPYYYYLYKNHLEKYILMYVSISFFSLAPFFIFFIFKLDYLYLIYSFIFANFMYFLLLRFKFYKTI